MNAAQAALGGCWPYFGFWAPRERLWYESQFRKYEEVSSLFAWLVTLGTFAGTFLVGIPELAYGLRRILVPVLIYQAILTIPFEEMDGFRVRKWSRSAYFVGLAVMVALVMIH